MAKSTKKRSSDKPAKPRPDFPLFAHQNGQWAKKVRGRLLYFGPWDDPDAAQKKWNDEKDDWLEGRTPRAKTDELTVEELANRFLTAKHNSVQIGELNIRSLRDYMAVCQHVADVFGKRRPVADLSIDDFTKLKLSFAKTHGPVRLTKDITVVKMLFGYGHKNGLCNLPLFGTEFKPPSKTVKSRVRQANGRKDFRADELRRIIDAAENTLRAMVLLGVNAGFGQNDISGLKTSHIDLDGGWVEYPRPKTATDRRCSLWPETVAAVRAAIADRPIAKDPADDDCVFLTARGTRCLRITNASRTDNTGARFNRLLESLGIDGRRGFYGLRHSFRTAAANANDDRATDYIMGHTRGDMGSRYIGERPSDERLKAVSDCVRRWLWPAKSEGGAK